MAMLDMGRDDSEGMWPPDLPCKLFPEEYLREVCAAWGQDEENAQPSKPMRGIGADALSHASRGQTQDEKDVSLRPVFQAAGHKVLSKTGEKRRREGERKKERKKSQAPLPKQNLLSLTPHLSAAQNRRLKLASFTQASPDLTAPWTSEF